MCIFTGAVGNVSKTKIFVTLLQNGYQFTCYENQVELANEKPVAMILPFPNEEQIDTPAKMWDMSGYDSFFSDMDTTFFPEPTTRSMITKHATNGAQPKSAPLVPLPIMKCGPFDYSIVPSLQDFERLNFAHYGLTLKKDVSALICTNYGKGFGFLVCICRTTGKRPPIAYIHLPKADGTLFVPTMHHHGNVKTNDDGKEEGEDSMHTDGSDDDDEVPQPPARSQRQHDTTKSIPRSAAAAFTDDWDHTLYLLNTSTPLFGIPDNPHGRPPTRFKTSLQKPLQFSSVRQAMVTDIGGGGGGGTKAAASFKRNLLPIGFPTSLDFANLNATFIKGTIDGYQGNGDLIFLSSHTVAQCLDNDRCTHEITKGELYAVQPWYYCYTCFPPDSSPMAETCGVCQSCAWNCFQKDHRVSYSSNVVSNVGGFCDTHVLRQQT